MSLAEGIESGLNLGLKFASFYKDKEKDDLLIEKAKQDIDIQKQAFESNMETATLTREEKQQRIDLNKIELGFKETLIKSELARNEASTEYTKENTRRVMALTDGIISENKRANINDDAVLFQGVLERLQEPDLNPMELNSTALMMQSIKSPLLRSQLKNMDEKYQQAFDRMAPVLTSGNFEELPSDFNENLTKIMKPKLDAGYLGARFITTDGKEGEVQEISLSGDFLAKGQGDQVILGSKVIVRIDGEDKEYMTFLPDQADDGSITFREDLKPDDSKAVSVADTVDYVASERHLSALINQNPNFLKNLNSINDIILETYSPISKTDKRADQAAKNAIFDQENSLFFTNLAAVNINDIKDAKLEDPEMQSALRVFYSAYGKNSGIIKEEGVYKPIDGMEPLQAIYSNAPKMSKIQMTYDNQPLSSALNRYKDDPNADGSPIYNVYGVNFPYDASIDSIKDSMIEHFSQNQEIQSQIEYFHEQFKASLKRGEYSEDVYAESLENFLKQVIGG
jgi:hypothetical protein